LSNTVFPSLIGLTWKRIRTPNFENVNQEAVSGLATRIALRPYPKYKWKLDYSYLGSGKVGQITNNDYATLAGFYNLRTGSFDSFLLTEPDDSTVTGQPINVGDGATLSFQLLRTFGGFSEPILAPNVVSNVYVNGTVVSNTLYTINGWSAAASNGGAGNPGTLVFNAGHAPGNGLAITADMTYYWPVHFDQDNFDFSNDMQYLWSLQKLMLEQVYN
jgi:uncharacterized protein (TIGR02217 family)